MLAVCEGFKYEGLTTAYKERVASDAEDELLDDEDDEFHRTKLKLKPSLYRSHFFNKEHMNLCSFYSPFGPILISIKKEGDYYRVLMYTETGGVEHVLTPKWTISRPWYMYILGQEPTPKLIYTSLKPELSTYKILPMGVDKNVSEDLLKVYEPEFSAQVKVGVLYCKAGQTTEQEMLANTEQDTSPAFQTFLNLLGVKVSLQGFTGYSGGLDIVRNSSGTHSVYTQYMNSEMMFHVSTLLPHSATDAKQIEKKKHIGNDRLVIVFKEGDQPFVPTSFKSKQTQEFIVIQAVGADDPLAKHFIAKNGDENKSPVIASDHITVSMISSSSGKGTLRGSRTMSKRNGTLKGRRNPLFEGEGEEMAQISTYYKVGVATRDGIPPCDPSVPDPPVFAHCQDFRTFLLKKVSNSMIAMRYSTVFETKTKREKSVQFLNVLHKYAPQTSESGTM